MFLLLWRLSSPGWRVGGGESRGEGAGAASRQESRAASRANKKLFITENNIETEKYAVLPYSAAMVKLNSKVVLIIIYYNNEKSMTST